jgi:hypothetical protein
MTAHSQLRSTFHFTVLTSHLIRLCVSSAFETALLNKNINRTDKSHDRLVGTEPRLYGLSRPGSRGWSPGSDKRFISSPQCPDRLRDLPRLLCNGYREIFSFHFPICLHGVIMHKNNFFFSLALQPPWALASTFNVIIIFTDGRTPWASDQLVAIPLPKRRTT